MRTTFDTIWRDLSPFTIGFDRTFDTLSLLAKNQSQNINYPPYNIRKLSDDRYSIELALAGFEEKDIDIEVTGENLVITGKRSDESNENLVHQGLASRNFKRKFVLSDDMVIKGAALSNGILLIGIERVIPDHKKPKKISFTSKENLLKN
ncbi:MAG: Hsp20 family protein [Pseudomonadota bacterium]|nr:Hsp20 family protein [Pseudomonadota bacterium]|tara:strand:- start:719 stop:1168 length:450 start_codon:yes stop_codon:yes gene_type:complete